MVQAHLEAQDSKPCKFRRARLYCFYTFQNSTLKRNTSTKFLREMLKNEYPQSSKLQNPHDAKESFLQRNPDKYSYKYNIRSCHVHDCS